MTLDELEALWAALKPPRSPDGISGRRAAGLPASTPVYLAMDGRSRRHLLVLGPDRTLGRPACRGRVAGPSGPLPKPQEGRGPIGSGDGSARSGDHVLGLLFLFSVTRPPEGCQNCLFRSLDPQWHLVFRIVTDFSLRYSPKASIRLAPRVRPANTGRRKTDHGLDLAPMAR